VIFFLDFFQKKKMNFQSASPYTSFFQAKNLIIYLKKYCELFPKLYNSNGDYFSPMQIQ